MPIRPTLISTELLNTEAVKAVSVGVSVVVVSRIKQP